MSRGEGQMGHKRKRQKPRTDSHFEERKAIFLAIMERMAKSEPQAYESILDRMEELIIVGQAEDLLEAAWLRRQ